MTLVVMQGVGCDGVLHGCAAGLEPTDIASIDPRGLPDIGLARPPAQASWDFPPADGLRRRDPRA